MHGEEATSHKGQTMEFLGFSLYPSIIVPALLGLVVLVLSAISVFKER